MNYYGGSLAVQYDSRYRLHPDEHYDALAFYTSVGARYAYGSGSLGSISINSATTTGTLNVSQSASIRAHELGINIASGVFF